MSNWKKYLLCFFVGFIVGGVSVGAVVGVIAKKLCKPIECPDVPKNEKPTVTVVTTSGKPGTITHSNWNFKGDSVCFKTTATGKAEARTGINKHLIPEAHKWMTYYHAIQANYGGLVYDSVYHHTFGVAYLHRWSWFALGGGPTLTYYEDKGNGKHWGGGFSVMMQVWFRGRTN